MARTSSSTISSVAKRRRRRNRDQRKRFVLLLVCSLVVLATVSTASSASAHEGILHETPLLEELESEAIFFPDSNDDDNTLARINTTASGQTTPVSAFCHFVSLNNYNPRGPFLQFALEAAAATALAIEHLNTGNGTIISEVQGLNQKCPIRFTVEHIDTQGTENVAVDQLIPILQRRRTATTSSTSASAQQPPPCAFIGPFYSQVAVATALYTSLKGYPQFSPLATAIELDNKETFPLFGRFVAPSASFASPLLEFLTKTLGVKHLAVLHSDANTDLTYVSGIRETIQQEYEEGELEMKSFSFNLAARTGNATEDYAATITAIRKTGFRYIFNLLSIDYFVEVLQEGHAQGIVGPSYTWIAGSLGGIQKYFLDQPEHLPDTLLGQIGTGMLSYDVTRRGSLPGYGNFDIFQTAWRDLGDHQDDLNYLQSKLPQSVLDMGRGQRQFYTNQTFANGFDATAVFYDVTIALGLAACHNTSTSTNNPPAPFLTGRQHYQAMLNTTMEGASGPIVLNPRTGSRDPRSIYYQITNVQSQKLPNGNITYEGVKSYFFGGEWIEMEPIVFSDNTTQIPLDLPPQQMELNHVGMGLRATGLTMSALVMVTSIGLILWTMEYKTSRIVMASQPIFLYIICFGTLLMGASIIPKSLDDQVVSDQGADFACATFPWLLAMGWCFAFSALFSKTYRINKIFHNPSFKRVKIEARDVMIPMLILLACNVLVLALWTGLDPLSWERYVVGYDIFGRPNETMGHCTSDNWLPYLISLGVVNMGALVVAIHQAWIARKISLEFAESEWIARVMNTILLVAFVGGPVLVIADEDPSAFYFVFCALIFVICMSLLVFIFGPKIVKTRSLEVNKRSSKFAIQETLGNINNTGNKFNNTTSDNRTESDPLDLTNHSGDSNFTTDSYHRPSSAAEGAKVLMHPALEKEKAAEMRALKKEKKKLRHMISMLEKRSTRGFGVDDAEKKGLLEEAQAREDEMNHLHEDMNHLQEDNQHLHEDNQHLHEETQHLQEDNQQLQDDLKHLEQQLERQHLLQQQQQQQLEDELRQVKAQLLQRQQLEEDIQQLVQTLREDNKQLQSRLQQKTQQVEDERRKLSARIDALEDKLKVALGGPGNGLQEQPDQLNPATAG